MVVPHYSRPNLLEVGHTHVTVTLYGHEPLTLLAPGGVSPGKTH